MSPHPTVSRLILGFAFPILLAAAPAAAQVVANIHRDVNYTGASLGITGSDAIADLGAFGWNDTISSVRLFDPRYDMVLYENPGFAGERIILSANDPDLRNFNARYHWNDRASSLRMVPKPIVELWSGPGFTGTLVFRGSLPQNMPITLSVRSIRFFAHPENAAFTLRLYEQPGLQGTPFVVLGDEPDVATRGYSGIVQSMTFDRPSGDWRELKFAYPVRANASVRASYGNQPVYRGPGLWNYVALASLDEFEANQSFDWKGNLGGHNGTDIVAFDWRASNEGALQVVAAADGRVILSRDGIYDHMGGTDDPHTLYAPCTTDLCDGSGNFVYLLHANGFVTQYAHLKAGTTQNFPVGKWVPRGTVLGVVGSSGASSAPHLHFGVYSGSFNRDFQPRAFSPLRRTDLGRSRFGRTVGINGRPEDRINDHGVYVCPWFEEPGTNEQMWLGPVPSYHPQDGSGPYGEPVDVFDLAVSAAPPWLQNPVPDVTDFAAGEAVYATLVHDGGRGSTRFQITAPNGGVVHVTAFSQPTYTFTASQRGDYVIEAQRFVPNGPAWETRARRTVRVFPGLAATTLRASDCYMLINGGGFAVHGYVMSIGDFDDGSTFNQGVAVFPPSNLGTAQLVAGRVRMRLQSIDGTNPFEKCAGCNGWGGRLFADLVATPGHQTLVSQAAQFELARTASPADGFMDASLSRAALDWIASHPTTSAALRIRWEYTTNRNATQDMINVEVTGAIGPYISPELTLYAKPPASVVAYGAQCNGGSGTPNHGFSGGVPRIPNPRFMHTVMAVAPGGIAIYMLGLSPVDVPIGSCRLLVNPDLLVTAVPVQILYGYAEIGVPIPDDLTLDGARLYSQWLTLVAPVPGLLSTSQGMETTLRAY